MKYLNSYDNYIHKKINNIDFYLSISYEEIVEKIKMDCKPILNEFKNCNDLLTRAFNIDTILKSSNYNIDMLKEEKIENR